MANSTRSGSRKKGAPHFHSSRGERGSTAGQRTRHQAVLEGCYQNEDLLHSITSLVGCCVEVQLKNGDVYEGILRTASSEMDLALELACLKPVPEQPISKKLVKFLQLQWANVVTVLAVGVASSQQKGPMDIFKTDTEISRTKANGDVITRDLQPFQFDDGVSGGAEVDALEGEEKGWDVQEMLAVNKEKFNYKTCFNEDLREYTTQITESDSPEFQSRKERAAQLEQEIESKKKGRTFDDLGSEEERYSSVVRDVAAMGAMGDPAVVPDPGPQSSSTPINGREKEEGERQDGTVPVPYDDKEKRKDRQVGELDPTAGAASPDQDGGTQHDSGLADSPVSEEVGGDSSPDKTLVDSKLEGEKAEAEPDDRSCQNEPQSLKKQSPKEVVRTFRLNPKATEFTPKIMDSLTPGRSPVGGPSQAAAWDSSSPINPIPANTSPVSSIPRLPRKSPRPSRPAGPTYPLPEQLAAICAGYNPTMMAAAAAAAAIRPLAMSAGGQVVPQQLSLAVTGASMTQPSAMMPVVRPQGVYQQVQGPVYNPPSFQLPAGPTPGQSLAQLYIPSSTQTQPQPVLSPQLASPTGQQQQQLIYLPTSSLQPLAGQGNTFLASQPPMGGGMPVVYPQHHHHHHAK